MANRVCPWWLGYTFDNPIRPLVHKPAQLFAPHVAAGMTVADLGCGLGYFSIGLARMVGPGGRVFAVDLQQEMLDRARRRAERAGVAEIIEFRRCEADDLGLPEPLDFALAFWMVHETPDAERFFRQVGAALKPARPLLCAEPKIHVSAGDFDEALAAAGRAGLRAGIPPAVWFSRAALLTRAAAEGGP